jgi:hypothetical protein
VTISIEPVQILIKESIKLSLKEVATKRPEKQKSKILSRFARIDFDGCLAMTKDFSGQLLAAVA